MGFGCGLCCVCGWVRQGLAVGFLLLQYSVVYAVSPYVCFISFLFLDLYFLVDDASMCWGYLVQTKHLFVLIHFRIKGEVGTVKHLRPSSFLLTIPRWCFFCGSFLLFEFHVSYAVLSAPCSLVVTCWERADLLTLLTWYFLSFLSLSCVVSWVRCGIWLYRFQLFAFFLTLLEAHLTYVL